MSSADKKYYLKPNLQIEPLVNKWHAYPFVLSPAAAAMTISNYHLKVMKSYIQMPMAHAAALKNPDMVGGPFIDYGGKRVEEIKALKADTEGNSKIMVDFANAVRELQDLLDAKAKGYPLVNLYKEIPPVLQGYVELYYDADNRPGFRLIESLLYSSPLYNEEFQSLALSLRSGDNRPFIFSTPRLQSEDVLHLSIPFKSEQVDSLVNLKTHPQSYESIKKIFSFNDDNFERFKQFLTEDKKVDANNRFTGEGVRVRFYGHACVLLETANVSVLTDPLISYKYDTDVFRYTYDDLPDTIDYVLITHAHHDHVVIETLLQLRGKIKNIIVPRSSSGNLLDPSLKLMLQKIGFNSVYEIDDLESIGGEGFSITGVPFFGEHCDLNIRTKSVYCVRLLQKSFLITADSNILNAEVYKRVRAAIGPVDVLFVGLECTGAPMSWSYGAFFNKPIDKKIDAERRSNGSNSNGALTMAEIFSCKYIFLYAMGIEPWLNYLMALQQDHSEATSSEIDRFLAGCRERGIHGEKLFASREIIF